MKLLLYESGEGCDRNIKFLTGFSSFETKSLALLPRATMMQSLLNPSIRSTTFKVKLSQPIFLCESGLFLETVSTVFSNKTFCLLQFFKLLLW
ncbi:Uncharacterised protein, partial [Mycoplasmopsis synoviae]